MIKITLTPEQKKYLIAIALVIVVLTYYYNKRYIPILDIEFEDDVATKGLLKIGFILPKKVEFNFNPEKTVEVKVKLYAYTIRTEPILVNGDFKGEYNLNIFKNSYLKKPYKTRKIYMDNYYVKYLKTPLGLI